MKRVLLAAALPLIACNAGRGAPPAGTDLAAPPAADLAGSDLPGALDLLAPDLSGPQTGDPVWAKGIGEGGSDSGRGVAADRAGNVLLTGYFSGSVDFGGGALASAGGEEAFLAKYGPGGEHLWSRRFGGIGHDGGWAVAADSLGNVILVASYANAVDWGGGPLTSAGWLDIAVAKYSPGGEHLWSRRFGGARDDVPAAVAVDRDDNILVAGTFQGSVDFGAGPLVSAGGDDAFLLKLGPDGGPLWSRRLGGGQQEGVGGVAVDGNGDVALAGSFEGAADLGGGALTSAGMQDAFVARYTAGGAFGWARRYGSTGTDLGRGVAVDGAGDLLVAGSFFSSIDLGGGPIPSSGSNDGFLLKLSPAGAYAWGIRVGGTDDDVLVGVAVDPAGAPVVIGRFQGTADFGGGPLTSLGGTDAVIGKYQPSGVPVWARRLGGPGAEQGLHVAVDATGHSLGTGAYTLAPDFGGGPLPWKGNGDLFLVRRAP